MTYVHTESFCQEASSLRQKKHNSTEMAMAFLEKALCSFNDFV